MEKLIPS